MKIDNNNTFNNNGHGNAFIADVVVPKGTLVCEHPLDKRASIKSYGKDFCWKCGEHITN